MPTTENAASVVASASTGAGCVPPPLVVPRLSEPVVKQEPALSPDRGRAQACEPAAAISSQRTQLAASPPRQRRPSAPLNRNPAGGRMRRRRLPGACRSSSSSSSSTTSSSTGRAQVPRVPASSGTRSLVARVSGALATGAGYIGRRYVDGSIRLDDLAVGLAVAPAALRCAVDSGGLHFELSSPRLAPRRVRCTGDVVAPRVSQSWVRLPMTGPPDCGVSCGRGVAQGGRRRR